VDPTFLVLLLRTLFAPPECGNYLVLVWFCSPSIFQNWPIYLIQPVVFFFGWGLLHYTYFAAVFFSEQTPSGDSWTPHYGILVTPLQPFNREGCGGIPEVGQVVLWVRIPCEQRKTSTVLKLSKLTSFLGPDVIQMVGVEASFLAFDNCSAISF